MKVIMVVLTALLALIGLSLLCSIPVMLLWNWLCPELLGLKEITLLQALGLSVLCSLLFKSGGAGKA